MFDKIQGYKQSSVLMAASQLGIFERIECSAKTVEEIAQECDINPLYLQPLLLYLEAFSYVEIREKFWSINPSFKNTEYKVFKSLRNIISYEAYIYQKWLTPEKIIAALRACENHRPFDLECWQEEGKILYKNTTYADNLKYLSVVFGKYIKQLGLKRFYCYGEGSKYLCELLQGASIGIEEAYSTGEADSILLYNKIHYMNPAEIEEVLLTLKEDISIIIVDFFHDKHSPFLNNLLIDWLTHGGINFIDISEIINFCGENGLQIIRNTFLKKICTNIIVIKDEGAAP